MFKNTEKVSTYIDISRIDGRLWKIMVHIIRRYLERGLKDILFQIRLCDEKKKK